MIKAKEKIPMDILCKAISAVNCVRIIDKTAAIKDSRVAETIDTKVSWVTCFSILF